MVSDGRKVMDMLPQSYFLCISLVFFTILSCYTTRGFLHCGEDHTAYTRTQGRIFRDRDRLIKHATLKECQEFCTQDKDNRGRSFHCRSFDYQPSANWCYLSRKSADAFQRSTLRAVGIHIPDTDHYEKVCLRANSGVCKGDYAAFSRIPQHVLVGYADQVFRNIISVETCLVKCLEFHDDKADKKCLSALYFYNPRECVLNTVSRFTHRSSFAEDNHNDTVDYFDNYCVGEWQQWSYWEACSATCGRGIAMRRRLCSDRNRCPGKDSMSKQCRRRTCFDRIKNIIRQNFAWGDWGECGVSCGKGYQTRRRVCRSSNRRNCRKKTGTRACNKGDCPKKESKPADNDGGWSSWSSWSNCPVTCGAGYMYRNRICRGGPVRKCNGQATQSKQCVLSDCIVSLGPATGITEWGLWSEWGRCTTTCGRGIRTRIRPCVSRLGCQNSQGSVQTRNCRNSRCNADAVTIPPPPKRKRKKEIWSGWGQWRHCSATCGTAKRVRNRVCIRGRCRGNKVQRASCSLVPCKPVWGQWSPWTACHPPCGEGHRVRVRLCIAGDCSREQSKRREKEECSNKCKAAWLAWGPWGTCTSTCGPGLRSRIRRCGSKNRNLRAKYKCPGKSKVTGDCDNDPCPTKPPEITEEYSEESHELGVDDDEAFNRFQSCCKRQGGFSRMCIKTSCRYNVTLDEIVKSIYHDDGCKMEAMPKYLECATDGNDNTECCVDNGISNELCQAGCRPPDGDLSQKLTKQSAAMTCAFDVEKILRCNRKGLEPSD